jgi:hypothetical protein
MSNASQGQGWWRARYCKWFPPQAPPPLPPPQGVITSTGPTYGMQPPSVDASPRKRGLERRPLLWVLLVIVVFFGGCGDSDSGVSTAVRNETAQRTLVYSVTGSGTSTATNITYETFEKGLVQVMDPRLPWTKTITASVLFTDFSLSVQNGPVGLSYVVCTIREDGKVLNTNKTAGPFHIASCDATENLS